MKKIIFILVAFLSQLKAEVGFDEESTSQKILHELEVNNLILTRIKDLLTNIDEKMEFIYGEPLMVGPPHSP